MKTQEELGTSTYSPEDNKLRFTPYARLSKEDYTRARNAGFIWAPKQELFVAPMWTPEREDLMIEWCGEVGDEDMSLVERAEVRAERFEDYGDKRKQDADSAHAVVESICEHIPLGQPILIGHHSERHARKDAERIQNGMRRAVKMWETSQYWQDRAKGAIRHAKYKERPDVRARRIKTIEAAKRKHERNKAETESALRFWRGEFKLTNKETGEKKPFEITETNRERIRSFLGGSGAVHFPKAYVVKKEGGADWAGWSAWEVLQPDGERYQACPSCTVAQCQEAAFRYLPTLIAHYSRWIAHYENRLAYERTMLSESGGIATDRKGPEKGGGCKCWASRSHHAYIQKVNKVSVTILDNWGNGGGNFRRTIPFDKLFDLVTLAEVEKARHEGRLKESVDGTGFYLVEKTQIKDDICPDGPACPDPVCQEERRKVGIDPDKLQAMRDTLKAGIEVVTASQLFPTPQAIAEQMADLADLTAGNKVLEPSAGTGNLIRAAQSRGIFADDICAIEINESLSEKLTCGAVVCSDFLKCNENLGKFDRILMNPPFSNGTDIKHIKHAIGFLNNGGKLVAICANGPRQREALKSLCDEWIDLPNGSFKEQGTIVQTAMIVINK